MPEYLSPGVYIQEVDSGTRPIEGVGTAVAAFVRSKRLGEDASAVRARTFIRIALDTARVRDERLGITTEEHVRPWIQAFTLGKPEYGPEQIRQ